MELTESQYQRIADCLPRQRGNVSMTNLQLLNALLYVVEHGCKWRGLPKHFGNWHTIYTRMNRWSKAGVLDRVFAQLQQEQILAIRIEHVCAWTAPPSKCIPTAPGRWEKTGRKPSDVPGADAANSRFYLVAANARCALILKLSPGQGRVMPRTDVNY